MDLAAALGTGFLAAVLWFDLMFDSQLRGHAADAVPDEVVASIAAYYRRVTTTAHPMSRLVAAMMLATMMALSADVVQHTGHERAVAAVSLALTTVAVTVAAARTVRGAQRLGTETDDGPTQRMLAQSILRDHRLCFTLIALSSTVQLVGPILG